MSTAHRQRSARHRARPPQAEHLSSARQGQPCSAHNRQPTRRGNPVACITTNPSRMHHSQGPHSCGGLPLRRHCLPALPASRRRTASLRSFDKPTAPTATLHLSCFIPTAPVHTARQPPPPPPHPHTHTSFPCVRARNTSLFCEAPLWVAHPACSSGTHGRHAAATAGGVAAASTRRPPPTLDTSVTVGRPRRAQAMQVLQANGGSRGGGDTCVCVCAP